jgi:uncharacterized protein (TIGR00369 family)
MSTKDEIQIFFDREFPDSHIVIENIDGRRSTIRRVVSKKDLRPGGTVSGPFMMTLADASIYATIFGELGLLAMAATTSLNINFLSKPSAGIDVIATCNLIKVGSKLVVGEVTLYSEGKEDPIAHAVGTYSIPSK